MNIGLLFFNNVVNYELEGYELLNGNGLSFFLCVVINGNGLSES